MDLLAMRNDDPYLRELNRLRIHGQVPGCGMSVLTCGGDSGRCLPRRGR